MSADLQPCKILGGSKETKVSFEWNFWEDILKIILLRHIQTGSFPYSSDGKYWLSIMMHGLPTQSLSKYYDLSNIFAIHSCLQPIKSEKWHFHVWRKHFIQSWRTCGYITIGFSMRETLHLFIKFVTRNDQINADHWGPFLS